MPQTAASWPKLCAASLCCSPCAFALALAAIKRLCTAGAGHQQRWRCELAVLALSCRAWDRSMQTQMALRSLLCLGPLGVQGLIPRGSGAQAQWSSSAARCARKRRSAGLVERKTSCCWLPTPKLWQCACLRLKLLFSIRNELHLQVPGSALHAPLRGLPAGGGGRDIFLQSMNLTASGTAQRNAVKQQQPKNDGDQLQLLASKDSVLVSAMQ